MADPTTSNNPVDSAANETYGESCDTIAGVRKLEIKEEAESKGASPLQPDAKIGMSFSFGKLVSQYGEATCDGIVPFLLADNEFPIPSIVQDPELLENLVVKSLPEYRKLWGNLLDEEIETRLRDYIIMASYSYAAADLHDPKYQVSIPVVSLAFMADDILDSADFAGSLRYKDGKALSAFFCNLLSGKYSSPDELATPMEAFRHLNAHIWAFYRSCKDNIPGSLENKDIRTKFAQFMDAHVLLMEKNDFSGTSKSYFRAIASGAVASSEYIAALFELEIPDQVREDLLFQRLQWYMGAATDTMNDIFGLGRDIRLGQVKDSGILSAVVQNGLSLQQAFDNTLRELCEHINDIRVAVATLEGLYAAHEDTVEYLRMLAVSIDGQIRAYGVMERYSGGKLQIVQISGDTIKFAN